jgi:hypothetical protein
MEPPFDPVRKRKFWLDFNLAYETRFEPDEIPEKGQPIYVSTLTNSLITAYLLGLGDRVRPTLLAMVLWMERRPEPEVRLFSEPWEHWHDGWYALYAWRRTLGLAKWLCGIEGAERHWASALQAEWQAWQRARPEDVGRDFHLRRESLTEHLVMALAAKVPSVGLQFRAAAGIKTIAADQPPLLLLGQWACVFLNVFGTPDSEFFTTGNLFLRDALWPEFLSTGRLAELALWLKVLAWDTGVVRTPEEAIARAYDLMPEVTRPDFVPK